MQFYLLLLLSERSLLKKGIFSLELLFVSIAPQRILDLFLQAETGLFF